MALHETVSRADKSARTREKILAAASELLKSDGYEMMTVRKICERAQISNGSFYHFFHSKDDMLSEFLMQGKRDVNPDSVPDAELYGYILQQYRDHADSCISMGVEFTASYYNAKNKSFNIQTRRPGAYPAALYGPLLARAQGRGLVRQDLPVFTIVEDIRAVVVGNVFVWCSTDGIFDLRGNLERMLRVYLDTIFTSEYFHLYPNSRRRED